MITDVSALAELAAFIVSYCERHSETVGVSCRNAIAGILASPVFADHLNRQAALYGYATEIGASEAAGFDTGWLHLVR